MLEIDGSLGEGGGQILRSALGLALVSGTPFRIRNIRAGRGRPGLLRQHLTAVRAAAAVGDAETSGAELHSMELTFHPRALRPGDYRFAVGSAGSATLVVQTVLCALLQAESPSSIAVTGGTHNLSAPPFEFLERAFLPLIARMGANCEARLLRAGFYPAGGGELAVRVAPGPKLETLDLEDPGKVQRIAAEAVVAGLPKHIAQREVAAITRELPIRAADLAVRVLPEAWGPGNVAFVTIERQFLTEVFTGFGRKGVRAEQVGREVALAAKRYLDSGAAVGEHLSDQLLVPLALAGGGRFTTPVFSLHAETNARIIERFLDVRVQTEADARGRCRVEIRV